jgi:hypothetical protein
MFTNPLPSNRRRIVALAPARMCLSSRYLAMGIYVTILSAQLRLGLRSGLFPSSTVD